MILKEKISTFPVKKYLLIIIIITILVRLTLMIMLKTWEFESRRDFFNESGEIASALVSGLGFSWPANTVYHHGKPCEPTSWEPPVYPFVIATVFKIFGINSTASAIVLLILQIISSAVCCFLIYLLGTRIFNEWVGFTGSLIFTFYPSEIHFSIQIVQATILFQILLLLFIFQIIRLADNLTIKGSILAGFSFGIAMLTVPAVLSLFPFALGWLYFRGLSKRTTRIFSIAIIVLTVCVTISPWLIRNYIVFDRFVFIKSNLSREFFMGNYGHTATNRIEENQSLAKLDEGERSELYTKKFLGSLMNNPTKITKRTYSRFKKFWTATPVIGGPYKKKTGGIKTQIPGIAYFSILILGISGLCLSLRKNKNAQLIAIAVVSLPIPYYLTYFSRFRYRFPIEPILIIFASYTLFQLWQLLKVKTTRIASRK